MSDFALSDSSRVIFRSRRRRARIRVSFPTISMSCCVTRFLKMTISSTRFRNSGRNWPRSASITRLRRRSCCSASSVMNVEPTLLVMMITTFLKSTVRVLHSGAGATHRVRHRRDGFLLANDALVQVLLHPQELGDLALEELRDRDTGPLGDDIGDVLWRHLLGEHLLVLLQVCEPLLSARDLLFDAGDGAVLELGRLRIVRGALGALDVGADGLELLPLLPYLGDCGLLLLPLRPQHARFLFRMGEVALALTRMFMSCGFGLLLQRFALDLEPRDGALDLVELGGHRVDLHAELRRGLVHEIDRLVRKKAIGDVAR